MKSVVLYTSQAGSTERYAQWIAQELGCEAVPWKLRSSIDFAEYDLVVFGSWIHVGSITSIGWAQDQFTHYPNTQFALFVVGASPLSEEGAIDPSVQKTLDAEFPAGTYPNLSYFFLPGGFDLKKLSFPDKLIMKTLFKQLDRLEKSEPQSAAKFRRMEAGFDDTAKENIAAIIDYAHSLES